MDKHCRKLVRFARMQPSERRVELMKAWASQAGYRGDRGGWISRDGTPIIQGWSSFAESHYLDRALDWVCRTATAFPDFKSMLNAEGNYRPTLRADLDWRFIVLAQEYDRAQKRRRDPRRAFTVGFHFDNADRYEITVSDGMNYEGNRMLIGKVPKWWSVRLSGPLGGHIEPFAGWIGKFATCHFTVQPMTGSRVLLAFEADEDAVVFRLSAENSPWGAKALRLRKIEA